MKIYKAFCVELSRSINIIDARNAYFEQSDPRKRFTFFCSSPECRTHGGVVVTGVNYDKVSEDSPKFQTAHFRSTKKELHSPNCKWVLEEDAKTNLQESFKSNNRSPNKQSGDGYIRRATFINSSEPKDISGRGMEKDENSEKPSSDNKKSSSINRAKRATNKLSDDRTSSSFSELVSDYLEIHRNRAWDTELCVDGLSIETYGQLFKKIEWYDDRYRQNHIYYGSVEIVKIYPENFEFQAGVLPSGISLKFKQEVTVDNLDGNPSLYITNEDLENTHGSHVLAESVNLVLNNDDYHPQLWCHFYGKIVVKDAKFTDKKTGDARQFKTLNVVPEDMNMLELVVRKKLKD